MTLDNVLPIDAEAARLLARRTTRLRWFVAMLTTIWLAILVPALIFTPLPPLGLLLVLAALVILAEHRFILFGDETAMTGSILVVVSAVFASGPAPAITLPIVIASLAGLYWRHVHRGQWTLVFANASALGIAAGVAATLTSPLVVVTGTWSALLSATVCVGVYWYINSVLIGCASAIRNGENIAKSILDQATSEQTILILSIAATLLSMHSAGRGLLSVGVATSLVLCIFELRLRSSRVKSCIRIRSSDIYIVALASTIAVASDRQDAITLVLIATCLVAASAVERYATAFALIVVVIAWSAAFAAERAGLPSAVQMMIAAEAALVACVVHLLLYKRASMKGLGSHVIVGLATPSAREMSAIIATGLAVQATFVASPSVLITCGIIAAAALVARTARAEQQTGALHQSRASLAS